MIQEGWSALVRRLALAVVGAVIMSAGAAAQSPLVVGTCTGSLTMVQGSAPVGSVACPVSASSAVNFAVANLPRYLSATPSSGTATPTPQNVVFTINAYGQSKMVPGVSNPAVSFQDTTNNVPVAARQIFSTVTYDGPPPNDNFANAIDLNNIKDEPGSEALTAVTVSHNATLEASEPGAGFKSVWWKGAPEQTGEVVLDTIGSFKADNTFLDTILEVYTGTALNNLVLLATNDDIPATGGTFTVSQIRANVVAGTTYYIRVSLKNSSDDGHIRLNIQDMPASRVVQSVARPYATGGIQNSFPATGGRGANFISNFTASTINVTPTTTAPGITFNPTSISIPSNTSARIRIVEAPAATSTPGGFIEQIDWGFGIGQTVRRSVDKVPSDTSLVGAILPSARATVIGNSVTAFATIINAGAANAFGCEIAPASGSGSSLHYQRTDAGNNPIGTLDEYVNIPANGSQSFVIEMFPGMVVTRDYEVSFNCANTPRASTISGVNTLLTTTALTQPPDIISIAVTPSNDGILQVPVNGAAAFAMAAINIGASAGSVTVQATDTALGENPANLPLTLAVCKTDAGGNCTVGPAASIDVSIANGEVHTYSVFANHSGAAIPLDPATNRIFVYIKQGSTVVGASSVATSTP
jgi:hypothetical protein